MTKSIEEQAEVYAEKTYPIELVEFPKGHKQDVNHGRRGFSQVTTIHVIEYSAYEQLKVENERLNKLAQGISEREESISAEHKLRIEIESENAVLKSKLEIAKKGLEFYADDSSWNSLGAFFYNRIDSIDESTIEGLDRNTYFGGKTARQALKEIEG